MQRPAIVVLGMMTKMPVAGVVWQTLHYLLGFERLGYTAYYVETHGRAPSMLMTSEADDGHARAATFIAAIMRRFGFGDRWAFRDPYTADRCFGMTERELRRVYGAAGMIVNLHGGTHPLPELSATDRLVYLETDPVQLQLELAAGEASSIAFLEPHCAFFTFAENYRGDDSLLPVTDRYDFRPTRQPVSPDLWTTAAPPAHDRFTTIGNWRQQWRDVSMAGETYTWSKNHEFEKFLGLPERLGGRFELALGSYGELDRRMLEDRGWRVTHAADFSMDLVGYRRFIAESAGEFTVAKDQNVRLRTGWFSDRSATYLASGRPVITQDTGFGRALPTGEGLFAFRTADDVAAAVEAIDADPARHRTAAREIAVEHFAPEVVLGAMLDHLGMAVPGRGADTPRGPFPYDMTLEPVSRRPTRLAGATFDTVLGGPLPPARPADATPEVSVVVVSYDTLPFTRMCVESLLADDQAPALELIVVDNGSTDGSPEYLDALARRDGRVRVLANDTNAGFPAACNQGLDRARGDGLVLLNSDTIVARGWLRRLMAHLEDGAALAGPVTNRIGNEAEVPTAYRTYGGYLREARARAAERRAERFEIPKLLMFCLAMRRDAFAALGPLDAAFGVGTMEDDDYSLRARRAGYELRCAEDVLVHHFGEASFGKLFADGRYNRVLNGNRRRLEEKWGESYEAHGRRDDPSYAGLVERVRAAVAASVPAGATVLMVSKGDERLVELEGIRAWHFPGRPEGWAGFHPADSAEAIAGLELMRGLGAAYVAFPRTSLWWLEFYEELAQHLGDEPVLRDDDCTIFAL